MTWMNRLRLAALEHTLDRLDRLASWRGRAPQLPEHLVTGFAGEEAAFFYLRHKGYTVVARRWSSGEIPGDIDLIAWQGSLLCFFEIKTRTARDTTPAHAAVDASKRQTLRRLARRYIRQLPQPAPPSVRFDVLSVYLISGQDPQFEHFEAAFPGAA
ncbi:MAG: YraN family protein [Terracidiphilus sp.]